MISARSRLGFESRSRRDRVCASRPPKAVATYLSVRPSSSRYELRQELYWAARGVPNGVWPRADPLYFVGSWAWAREGENCECAAGCRLQELIPGAVQELGRTLK